ncbi:MAG: T9SS type A sorting domain-containing protein [Bacteroidia bacterium]
MLKNSLFVRNILIVITVLFSDNISVAQTYYQKLGEWQIDNTINSSQVLNLSFSKSDKIALIGKYFSNGTPGSMNINYMSSCGNTSDFIYLDFDTAMVFNSMFRLGGLGGETNVQNFYTGKFIKDTLLFIGDSFSPDTGCEIHSTPQGGNTDIWAVISDTVGNVKKERFIGTSFGNDGVKSSIFMDSCFILSLYFNVTQNPNGDLWNVPPNCVSCPSGSNFLNLSTFNYSLQKINEKYIGPVVDDLQGILMYDSIHHYVYLVGLVNTTQPNVMNVTQSGNGNDVWVMKMDEQLNLIWDKRILTLFDEFGIASVKFLPNGNLLIAGQTSAYYGSGLQGTPRGDQDIFIYELDTAAQLINDRCYGTAGFDAIGLCSVLKNGQIMVSIRTADGISGDKTETSRGNQDMWYLFLDSNLDIIYQKTLGGSGVDDLILSGIANKDENIFEWPDGSILVKMGSSSGVSGDKTIPASSSNPANRDIWLVRFLPGLLTGLEESPTLITAPFVFPNPTRGTITMQVENATKFNVMQPDGRVLLQEIPNAADQFTVDCSAWSSGVYFVEVLQGNGTRWLNKIVKE